MTVAVIRAGAVGGPVGDKLAMAGADVTFAVRGTHVDASG
jgi:ketopantoate reductase